MSRHFFRIEASYGPEQLFKLLKSTCGQPAFHNAGLQFDFDWMKRKVELRAPSEEVLAEALEVVTLSVNRDAGPGQLLPGAVAKQRDRHVLPIGVLLQTPDVFVEMIAGTLAEIQIPDIRMEHDGNGLSVPVTMITKGLQYAAIVRDFPLPGYLKLVDEGISE